MMLYYVHDPMCSWCYAFDATLKHLEALLPESICFKKIVGGLAPDSNVPMPEHLQHSIRTAWKQIEKTVPGIQFNYDFWDKNQPYRSTYPSCRAVLAAKKQSSEFEGKMIEQIQWCYYQNAENPSLDDTLAGCAQYIGLNMALYQSDYSGELVEAGLIKEIQFSRKLGISSYPSLCLEVDKKIVSIVIDYNDAQSILKQILDYI